MNLDHANSRSFAGDCHTLLHNFRKNRSVHSKQKCLFCDAVQVFVPIQIFLHDTFHSFRHCDSTYTVPCLWRSNQIRSSLHIPSYCLIESNCPLIHINIVHCQCNTFAKSTSHKVQKIHNDITDIFSNVIKLS